MNKLKLKDLVYKVNGAAIEVHKALGPGLLESVYHKCLMHELQLRGVDFYPEMSIPVRYKDIEINTQLKCDLFIENCLVVELKAVDEVLPIHQAQLLSYMKLLKAPMGLLINFNCVNVFNAGQKTYVNEFYEVLS
ncbi:GxxExxY protein [Solitalea canadensis]|uniref:GxxExxY protein n=1 Tax=Solitalea canadensis (strain ATCC 29591 / DSM 3403 / JCM 21819 / LMG 8368 / NBRC 15130 / NCIMB 12057 / USAM 9D) TaxID=929556 RepID=H8KPL3_SOLCM|nr:GxxExxY protein [Solitalea canadensis]AFD05911.1 hypothetical protein Solca_0792 [Solitalea canadensis DSM 3403]